VGPYRGEGADAARAELYALYVRPDLLGRGVGGVLVRAAEEWAAGRGHTRLALWVLAGNERARRFYARAGFAPDGGERVDAYDGAELTEVRYERSLTT
jgi:GNAT superfamily N-acetyltransferase